MEISTKEIEAVSVVRMDGNLDTNTAPEAQQHLDALQDDGVQKILVGSRYFTRTTTLLSVLRL